MKAKHYSPFAAFAAITAAATAPLIAAPGSLHTGFNSSGTATASYGGTENAAAVAVMTNGKIVVAGSSNTLGHSDIAVLRYNADGSLDTSFSSDGGTLTDVGSGSEDFATGVAVLPDGKILVCGYSNANGDNDFLLARYNADGTLDTFFGSGGRVLTNFYTDDRASALVVQPDGKIVVAGYEITDNNDFAIARYNADGSLDTSFSADGKFDFTFGGVDICRAVALQADGKILMAGHTTNATEDFALARLNTNGTQDNSFDTDGEADFDFGDTDRANGVVVQPDGKIVVAGTWDGGQADFAILRYNPDGTLDTSFSGDGSQNVSFAPAGFGVAEFCQSVALQPDGKIVLGGYTNQFNPPNDFGLVRLRTDGALDTSFDGDGKAFTNFSTATDDRIAAIALQADGRLVAVGSSGTDFALARYNMLVRTDARVGPKNSAPKGNNVYNSNGAGQSITTKVKNSGGTKNNYVRIQNDGHDSDSFTISGPGNNKNFKLKYFNGNTNVTNAVKAGTFSTGNLAPGASFALKVEITAKTKKANKKRKLLITGKSVSDSSNTDTVRIDLRSK